MSLLATDDFEDPNDSGSLSKSASDSVSGSDLDSDSDSVLDSGSDIDHESGPSTKPSPGTDDPPLSRNELLAYLENMRQRFLTKPTPDSFADQDEEVLIVTSKKKLRPHRTFKCTTANASCRDLPKLNPGKLPEAYFAFETAKNGKVTLVRDTEVKTVENLASTSTSSQQYVPAPPPPPPEVRKSGMPVTKKEKKAVCSPPLGLTSAKPSCYSSKRERLERIGLTFLPQLKLISPAYIVNMRP